MRVSYLRLEMQEARALLTNYLKTIAVADKCVRLCTIIEKERCDVPKIAKHRGVPFHVEQK